jgi:hypothetical protein
MRDDDTTTARAQLTLSATPATPATLAASLRTTSPRGGGNGISFPPPCLLLAPSCPSPSDLLNQLHYYLNPIGRTFCFAPRYYIQFHYVIGAEANTHS